MTGRKIFEDHRLGSTHDVLLIQPGQVVEDLLFEQVFQLGIESRQRLVSDLGIDKQDAVIGIELQFATEK